MQCEFCGERGVCIIWENEHVKYYFVGKDVMLYR